MPKKKADAADKIDVQRFIYIKGARSNNLKNIDLAIPKNELVVVTGLSGSGKSSLTMDTLYAEGQRRYVESLSSYARQFLMRMKKPDVDYIKGICPAIAIEQKVSTANNRSTVGSITEIYDYLRLLYARIGKIISPVSGREVKRHSVSDVVDYVRALPAGTKVLLLIDLPHKYKDRSLRRELELFMKKGFARLYWKQALHHIDEFLESHGEELDVPVGQFDDAPIRVLIDRFIADPADEDLLQRVADSVQTAFYESEGQCTVHIPDGDSVVFNNRLELDGIEFPEPTVHLFNYNNPYGACPRCQGYGKIIGISEEKVIPNDSLSLYEGAVLPWQGASKKSMRDRWLVHAAEAGIPIHRPYRELTPEQKHLVWHGNGSLNGIYDFFKALESKMYKIQNRVLISRYRGKTTCPECQGGRLRKEATYVKVGGKSITELDKLPVDRLLDFFQNLQLSDFDQKVAERLLLEITTRLRAMLHLGLDYLTIDRVASTLSGGETQRINLTRTLGSNLTSSLYILDEPSVGLHPRDTQKLIGVLKNLRDLGNTVLVVEHEEAVIRQADFIVDMGPGAGRQGGEIVFAGPYDRALKSKRPSLTMDYLTGRKAIEVPKLRRKPVNYIKLRGAAEFNLKGIDVDIPLQAITVVSGVSGSGKTTLVKRILYPAIFNESNIFSKLESGHYASIEFDEKLLSAVEMIGQKPIGKSSRSNPVTYMKAYDDIRKLMAAQRMAMVKGLTSMHFSFNVEGGRCKECKGEGEQVVEMQFLADIRLTCEACKGKRFKKEVLSVTYKDKNIFDILSMTVDEALDFFKDKKAIYNKLKPLADVGLGYVSLGQPSSTLSGGEAQRIKLAHFLSRQYKGEHILFIFDEPTTGLHFHDIRLLLKAFNSLVEMGHTVLIVEHNLEVIKTADWVIDLGPEGGDKGGRVLYQGPPEGLTAVKESYTGRFLKEVLSAASKA